MKICSKCKLKKSKTEFLSNITKKDGYDHYCKICRRIASLNSYKKYNSKKIIKQKERKRKIKIQVLSAYGNKCICCDETIIEFLTIDHINNDGAKHRQENNFRGTAFYSWLIKNNYPKDNFQILCMNCNFGKKLNNGICPHLSL